MDNSIVEPIENPFMINMTKKFIGKKCKKFAKFYGTLTVEGNF